MITAQQLRQKFLSFFEKKGHKIIPSASLIPENDPTVLFTTAGMHPLVPYLLGEPHPLGKRLVDVQKCLRTDDIDEVGDEAHLTFFEMLGNWSLGDYFKKEAIAWSFEFLTKELNIPLTKLAVSVFKGDKDAPRDEESAEIWQQLGIAGERIAYLGKKDNWWGPAGQAGPCGPDTEMFYWTGSDAPPKKFNPQDGRWFEIWNDVFMEYNKTTDGKFEPLKQKNVDTGMGVERTIAALNGKSSVYETEVFLPIVEKVKSKKLKVKSTSKKSKEEETRALRIVADHIKAATFILAEGVVPANLERGYVLRRLIRRAIRYGKLLDIEKDFTTDVAAEVIKIYQDVYPEVKKNQQFIFDELKKEESRFRKTLERGLREFSKLTKANPDKSVTGKVAFDLYQTYGFPIEMTKELAKEQGLSVDEKGFQEELEKHQELSRTAARGKFKSGLADHSKRTIKYHTTTHLLHTALRQVLGQTLKQMGSNINPQRLRFDFSYDKKLTDKQIREVEKIVNQKIEGNLLIKCETMPFKKAIDSGALAFFKDKYPDKVIVYSINNFSREVCTGPHVKRTGELGKFKIIKQESAGANLRRIKAVLE